MSIIHELAELGQQMIQKGLVVGPGGNISGREGDLVYLSPSGFDVDRIKENEWAVIDLKKEKQVGGLKPTCEVEMHLRTFHARPDIRLVCHAHPTLTTGIISAGKKIMSITPDFVALVDQVEYLPFIPPAGKELAVAVEAVFKRGVNVVCLANHGAICVGCSAREALARMLVLEDQARVMLAGLMVGKPRELTEKEQTAIRNMDAETYRKKLLAEG